MWQQYDLISFRYQRKPWLALVTDHGLGWSMYFDQGLFYFPSISHTQKKYNLNTGQVKQVPAQPHVPPGTGSLMCLQPYKNIFA